jgi:hypothetical protein
MKADIFGVWCNASIRVLGTRGDSSSGFARKVPYREDFSRKGAKAQSATAFLKGFLCAFAPLREKYFFFSDSISDFSCKASSTLSSPTICHKEAHKAEIVKQFLSVFCASLRLFK